MLFSVKGIDLIMSCSLYAVIYGHVSFYMTTLSFKPSEDKKSTYFILHST